MILPNLAESSTYQAVSLSAVHETIHDVDDFEPQIQHPVPFGKQYQILKEHLAEKGRCLNSCLTHSVAVGRVYFGFQQLQDQREQDFAKYRGPFTVIIRR